MAAATRQRSGEREALFVRIPRGEARRLDRAAFELGVSKQDLVAGLVARYVDPASPASLAALRELSRPPEADEPRLAVAPQPAAIAPQPAAFGPPAPLPLGHAAFTPAAEPTGEVLTLADVAALLRVDEDAVMKLAEAGELPGRRIGGAWRFARRAILDWLAQT